MPTYPYACTECRHQFETRQSFSDDPLTVCPECNGRLRKVWGSVGVVFKGSGFYRTDSRSADSKSSGGGDSSSSTSSGGASGSNGSSEKQSGESKSGDKKSSDKKSESSTSKAASSAG